MTPDFDMPPGGLNIRWPDPPNDQEYRLQRYKLRGGARVRARERVSTARSSTAATPRLGIVTTGKAHLDVLQALDDLGIDQARAGEIGIKLFKVGMSWPLEPEAIRQFRRRARGDRRRRGEARRRREPAQGAALQLAGDARGR